MRLIDADSFVEEARNRIEMQDLYLPIHIKEFVIDEMPTVDAVEVIHCEHCRHHEKDSSSDSHWCFVWETFTDNHVYCSFAERRQDG